MSSTQSKAGFCLCAICLSINIVSYTVVYVRTNTGVHHLVCAASLFLSFCVKQLKRISVNCK